MRSVLSGPALAAVLAGSAVCAQVTIAQNATQAARPSKSVRLGGDGGWDYLTVDTAAHRLYLSRSSHVMVVDTDRDSVVGDLPNTPGVHGVAIARDLGKGFTSNGRDSSVTVFDPVTLTVLATVRGTGRNPDAILYDPGTRRVFTFDGGSAGATAIDATTNAIVGTVALGGKPETAQVDGNRVFVNIEDRNEVAVFDPSTLTVIARWPLAPCEEPTGMAIDRRRHRLFIGCGNATMAIVDYTTGTLLGTAAVGAGVDGAGFDPATGTAFTSNGGDGTLSVVREVSLGKFGVVATVPTMRGARTMVVDERTHRVYTVSAEFGPAPTPTTERPRPRAPMVPGSFTLIVIEP